MNYIQMLHKKISAGRAALDEFYKATVEVEKAEKKLSELTAARVEIETNQRSPDAKYSNANYHTIMAEISKASKTIHDNKFAVTAGLAKMGL